MKRLTDLIKKHKIISLPLLMISLYILGYVLLVISYCFPTGKIKDHISQDLYSIVSVGEWIPGHDDTVPDYYTDSIMLLEAEFDSEDPAFIASIKSPRALQPDSAFVYETYIGFNEESELPFYEYDYYRYWHGYLIFLKPLLFFFSLGTVKYLTVLFQFVLIFLVLYQMTGAGLSFRYSIPLLAAYLFINPITIGLSFQFNTVYVITLCAIAVLFADYKKKKYFGEFSVLFFFLTGAVTSYFDLLTYPLLTFGIPALYYFLLYSKNEKKDLTGYISSAVAWIAGFGGMWLGKWGLAAAVSGGEAFYDIRHSISVRSGYDASESYSGDFFSYFDVLHKNLSVQTVYGLLIVLFVICIIMCGVIKNKTIFFKENRTFMIICLITALIPFVWYFILPNHSWIHYWFTYRTLAVSACSIVMISLVCSDKTRS